MKQTLKNATAVATFAFGVLLGTPQMANANLLDVIYDNGGTPGAGSGLSSQKDTSYPFDSQVADDFVLGSGSWSVTDVHWYGVCFNPDECLPGEGAENTLFNINFYNDAGGVPTGGPNDPTGTAIDSQSIVVSGSEIDTNLWEYWTFLDTPLLLQGNTTYWLGIQAEHVFPPQWGWVGNGESGNAVQGFPLLGTDYWTSQTNEERSFVLTGHRVEVPEPGTLGLLGIGLAALGFARRKRTA